MIISDLRQEVLTLFKSLVPAFTAVVLATAPVSAQQPRTMTMANPTTWNLDAQSMSVLLNSGWSIQATSGSEGEVFLLVKANKYMTCILTNEGERLSTSLGVASRCHRLN